MAEKKELLHPSGLTAEEIEELLNFRPSDEDRPETKAPILIKSDEESKIEYEEKCKYLLDLPRKYQVELVEIDCREFISWIFERRVGYQRDIVPFEDKMSNEYKLWLDQKRKGKKEIDYKGYACWRYNPIVFYLEKKKGRHRVMLKDDEETLSFIEGRQFAIMAPITYVGRNNTSDNARYLYALAFDLDGVGVRQIKKLIWMMSDDYVPMANLITNSGHGLHIYYLLEEPVPLYQENLPILNKLKHGLTNIMWNDRTSEIIDRQHQSVLQGFRLPGTLTKFGVPIKCYYNADAPMYTIEKLNEHLASFRLTDKELKQLKKAPTYNPTGTTLEEAERRWPEWYAARVLQKKRIGRKWHVNRNVYDWWLNRLRNADDEIKVHHRYWCILALVVYAVKCDIPREEVLADAYSLVPKLDTYTEQEDNHFTEDDVNDAMKAYDENYNKWPIHTIETTTLFRIDRNKRSGKHNQKEHLKIASFIRDNIAFPDGSWRDGNGRKPEADKVQQWRKEHPESNNKALCARDLGISRTTVAKWWNKEAVTTFKSPAVKIIKEKIMVNVAKLFSPGSEYTIEGFTHEELLEAVTSGKWRELGLDLAI